MKAFIAPPQHIPFFLKIGIWFAERTAGKTLLPARLLAWYPKAAVSSAVLEGLIAHHDGKLDERMLKLVRMQTSFAVACPFCIDMNSFEYVKLGITGNELRALQGRIDAVDVETFSERERAALRYTKLISATPLQFSPGVMESIKAHFTERELVILASTAAQVNYWARLIQALGIPPVGYGDVCEV